MVLQLIGLLLFVGVSCAIEYPGYHSPIYHTAPAIVKTVAAPVYKQIEYESPAHYDFAYSVHDAHTGDIKSQSESRKGDVVHGQYSLIDSDGYQRIVDYTADPHNGFNAIVRREPLGHKVVAAPVTKYVAAPSPIIKYAAAPSPIIKYAAAPIAKVAYAAPAHVSFTAPAHAYHY